MSSDTNINPFPGMGLTPIEPREAMNRVVKVLGRPAVKRHSGYSDPLEIGYLLVEQDSSATVAGLWEVYEVPDALWPDEAGPLEPRMFVMVPPLDGPDDKTHDLDCIGSQCTWQANRYEIGLSITCVWLFQLWNIVSEELTPEQDRWFRRFFHACRAMANEMPGDGPSVFFNYTD